MTRVSVGIDIGGTKCALSFGACTADAVRILHREEFPTCGAHVPMDGLSLELLRNS